MTYTEDVALRRERDAALTKVKELETALRVFMKTAETRIVFEYYFEGGDSLRLTTTGNRPTTEFLDALDEMLKLKRIELAKIAARESAPTTPQGG